MRKGITIQEMQKAKLTLKQELFCQYFVFDEETRGNGTLSYQKAYEIPKVGRWAMTCSQSANVNLKRVKVAARLNEILKLYLDDNLVDNELAYVVAQKGDLLAKVQGIKEYNRLKRRVEDKFQLAQVAIQISPVVAESYKINEPNRQAIDNPPGQAQIQSSSVREEVRQDGGAD